MHSRDGNSDKNEFLEVLFIDKVFFIFGLGKSGRSWEEGNEVINVEAGRWIL